MNPMNEIYLYIAIALSATANAFLLWYLYQMLTKYGFLNTNIGNLRYNIIAYGSHLKKIYESETFYGEPTLERLLIHSREIKENIEDFCRVFNIEDEEEFAEWEWYQYGTDQEEGSDAEEEN